MKCYMLAVEANGFGGMNINAMVVDKYCEKYGIDFLEMLEACKAI